MEEMDDWEDVFEKRILSCALFSFSVLHSQHEMRSFSTVHSHLLRQNAVERSDFGLKKLEMDPQMNFPLFTFINT